MGSCSSSFPLEDKALLLSPFSTLHCECLLLCYFNNTYNSIISRIIIINPRYFGDPQGEQILAGIFNPTISPYKLHDELSSEQGHNERFRVLSSLCRHTDSCTSLSWPWVPQKKAKLVENAGKSIRIIQIINEQA